MMHELLTDPQVIKALPSLIILSLSVENALSLADLEKEMLQEMNRLKFSKKTNNSDNEDYIAATPGQFEFSQLRVKSFKMLPVDPAEKSEALFKILFGSA